MQRDRGTADLAQDELRPMPPRHGANGNERAEIKAGFRADNHRRFDLADDTAQARNGIAQLPARNGGNANHRIQQRPQRAILMQRQHRNVDAFGGERVAQQDDVSLRAATFESAQHYGKTRSRYVGMQHLTQHSGTHHGLYGAIWHLAGTSHDKSLPSKHRPDIPTTFVNSSPFAGYSRPRLGGTACTS